MSSSTRSMDDHRNAVTVRWSPLPIDDGRAFVYSPRFGRTYLLPQDLVASPFLPIVFGLKESMRRDDLCDPAASVLLDAKTERSDSVGPFLPRLYRFFHRHRSIASIHRVLVAASLQVRLKAVRRHRSVCEIGRIVMAVEYAAAVSDCYPRALITAMLCMSAQVKCQVAVGILAPTANLHAWCSTAGTIPYEPDPHHWWYRPLVVFDVGN